MGMMTRLATLLATAALLATSFVTAPRTADGQEGEGNEIRWIISGIDVEEGGYVRCALYRDENTWLNTARRYRRAAAAARRGQVACVFRDVPPGTYAMAALHDADNDHEMDKSLIGLPQEGYAISRDEHNALSRPDFDDASVQHDGGRLVTRSRMRY
tara:strand:- start:391 stop:861 length:471 start_codon:yes stop_codon:yes gene_type:complete